MTEMNFGALGKFQELVAGNDALLDELAELKDGVFGIIKAQHAHTKSNL